MYPLPATRLKPTSVPATRVDASPVPRDLLLAVVPTAAVVALFLPAHLAIAWSVLRPTIAAPRGGAIRDGVNDGARI